MTKLDATQESYLKAFEAAYSVLAIARRDLRVQMEIELEDKLTAMRIDASKAGNVAVGKGVPITKLGDKKRPGLQTTDFATIRRFLDLTKDLTEVTADDVYVDPLDEKYEWDSAREVLTVTMPEFTPSTARFYVREDVNGSRYLAPTEETQAASVVTKNDVIGKIQNSRDNYAAEREALAWIEARP